MRHQHRPRGNASSTVLLVMVGIAAIAIPSASAAGPESKPTPGAANSSLLRESWKGKVQPLLREHCVKCHGSAKQSSELSLSTVSGLLAGGSRGPTIDREHPESSLLLAVLDPEPEFEPHMPPDGQLGGDAIAALRDWVVEAASLEPAELTRLTESPEPTANRDSTARDVYPAGVDPALVIDLAIQTGWREAEEPIESRPLCDDRTFVRRLYLDLVGRIPTPAEADAFLAETRSDKRARLIDRLLETREHAAHLAEVFDAVLMGRGNVGDMRRRERHGWLDYLADAFEDNRPWDKVAREILLARPDSPDRAGAVWYLYERKDRHQQIAEAVSRGFFGVQIQCAQCHDHPLADEIKQSHYWGLVAFFNRGENVDTSSGPRVAESAVGGFSMFTNLEGESQPNRLVFLDAEPVEESRPPEGEQREDRDELYVPGEDGQPRTPKFSRRQQFVDNVLDGHPLVAKAMVNRLWALLMGRGIVHPVDGFDSTHPPSHPELLWWLAEDFRRSGYDVRRLLSQIARSRTYQLNSETDVFVDPSRFAVAATRPLTAEALYRSLLVALDVHGWESEQTPEKMAAFRETFPDVLPEKSVASVRQGLLMTNGSDIHEWLSPERSGTVAALKALDDTESRVEEAFRRILGRSPDRDELRRSVDYLKARSDRPHEGVDQLAWALLTSAEFRFNH